MVDLDSGFGRAVQHTRELARVLSLPRRVWSEESAEQVARELTILLRKANGSMVLRAVQAQALLETGIKGGLFAPIRVGGGKTLLSLLAPLLLESRRPLLILPAKLIEKTKREWRILATHWQIPNYIQIKSYEWLGRIQAQRYLEEEYQPDCLILDEAHKVKNVKAAVTRRLVRFKRNRPEVKVVAMSGTITKRSLKDFAHIIMWCLGAQNCPIPTGWTELEDWADALDESTNASDKKLGIGYLSLLCNEEERKEPDSLVGVRRAFGRRLSETKGVVSTAEGLLGCSLTIEALEVNVSKDTDDAFDLLRKTWNTPDGWPLTDPLQVWRVARELSLGFYNRWEPRPPPDWMIARKEVSAVFRDILSNNKRNLDSLLMVVNAIDDGYYPEARPILDHWRLIELTFTPHSVPVWFDDSCIKAAAHWSLERPGIIWCEHVPFAERLAKYANLSYYGRKGLNANGRYIADHPAGESLIASVASNAEGCNLQKWNRNLVTSCPPANGGSTGWEQLLGRTHRDGQLADEVECQLFITSIEHINAFVQALKDANHNEQMMRQPQKLLYADTLVPTPEDVIMRPEHRWKKGKRGT